MSQEIEENPKYILTDEDRSYKRSNSIMLNTKFGNSSKKNNENF